MRWRAALAFVAILVACDIGLAQIAKRMLPQWFSDMPGSNPRAFSPIFHHGFRPTMDTWQRFGPILYKLRTNSLGMVDAAPREVDAKGGGCRLLLMGDSFTEGVGNAWADAFAGRLSAALAPKGAEVLNAGVVSYAPTVHWRKLRHLLDDRGLRVDSVLLFLDLSDIADEWEVYDLDAQGNVTARVPDWLMRRQGQPGQVDRLLFLLQDNSLTLHLFRDLYVRAERGWRGEPPDAPRPADPPPRAMPVPPLGAIEPPPILLDAEARARRLPGAWEDHRARWTFDQGRYDTFGRFGLVKAAAMMDRIVQELRARKIGLTVAIYPWPDQIVVGDRNSVQQRFWAAWAGSRGVALIDLFPLFLDAGDPRAVIDRYIIPRDFHWNAAGHALVADALLPRLDPTKFCAKN